MTTYGGHTLDAIEAAARAALEETPPVSDAGWRASGRPPHIEKALTIMWEFGALSDPATVLALVADVRALTAERDQARARVGELEAAATKAARDWTACHTWPRCGECDRCQMTAALGLPPS